MGSGLKSAIFSFAAGKSIYPDRHERLINNFSVLNLRFLVLRSIPADTWESHSFPKFGPSKIEMNSAVFHAEQIGSDAYILKKAKRGAIRHGFPQENRDGKNNSQA